MSDQTQHSPVKPQICRINVRCPALICRPENALIMYSIIYIVACNINFFYENLESL